MIHGPIQQPHPVFGTGLCDNIADVVINGALADRQRHGDFLIREPLSDLINDFDFPFGKVAAEIAWAFGALIAQAIVLQIA